MVRLAGHAQKRGGAHLQSSYASKIKEVIMNGSVQVLEGLLEAQTQGESDFKYFFCKLSVALM